MTPSDDSIMSMMGDCSTEPPAIKAETSRLERLCAACGKRFGLHSTHKPQKCPGPYGWEKTTFIEAKASPECPMGIEAVKARCESAVRSARPFEDRCSRDDEALSCARALLIAIAYIEQMKSKYATVTAEIIAMGFEARAGGAEAQTFHDEALSGIAQCFQETR